MMTSNLETIEIILKWGNITKAALEMGITQPGLTSWINKLEKTLGCKVFDRSKVPIVLTKEGNCYKEYLIQCKILENNLNLQIDELRIINKKIVIGAPSIYIKAVLVELVTRFKQSNPDCCVEIWESTVPDFEKKMETGDMDLFLSTRNTNPSFSYIPIFSEKIMLCVLKDSQLDLKFSRMTEEGGQPSYQDLNDCEFVMLRDNQPLQIEAEKFIQKYKLKVKKSIIVNQVQVAVEFVERLGYCCFVTECAIEKLKDNDNLKFYSLEKDIPNREIYLAYNEKIYQTDMIKRFIQVTKDYQRPEL